MGFVWFGATAFALLPITETFGALPDFPLDNREMEVRAGYFTEDGKYLGGFPSFVDGSLLYECTEFQSSSSSSSAVTVDNTVWNATVCTTWTADVTGSDVYDSCSCKSVAHAAYCEEWTCSQRGVENALCSCDTTDDDPTTSFCSSWECFETGSDGAQGVGKYQCLTSSSTAGVCEAWTGVTERPEEWKASSCACAEQLDDADVCSSWECKERRIGKCSHGGGSWCNIGVSIGVGCFFGSFGAMLVAFGVNSGDIIIAGCSLKDCIVTGFFWMLGWFGGVIVWGGQDGAACAGIWWGAIIVLGLLYRLLCNHRYRGKAGLDTFRGRAPKPVAEQDTQFAS